MNNMERDHIRFVQRVRPTAKTGITASLLIIVAALFCLIFEADIVYITTAVGIGSLLIVIFATYHNWGYFSQLDDEEMKNLASIWKITHWLIIVWLAASVFLSVVAFKIKLLDMESGTLVVIFIGLIVGVFNVWYPRIRRREKLREIQEPVSLRDKFQQLRERHYEIAEEAPPDWEKLENEAGFDRGRIIQLKLAEARTVYSMKKFIEIETRFADSISILVSALIVFLIPIVQNVIVEIIKRIMVYPR